MFQTLVRYALLARDGIRNLTYILLFIFHKILATQIENDIKEVTNSWIEIGEKKREFTNSLKPWITL